MVRWEWQNGGQREGEGERNGAIGGGDAERTTSRSGADDKGGTAIKRNDGTDFMR
jgi:hypothetical protein